MVVALVSHLGYYLRKCPTVLSYQMVLEISLEQTIGVLSKFFDYYVTHFQTDLTYQFDVHSLLVRYLTERNVEFDGSLNRYLDFAILRDNTNEMFKDGKLDSKYSIQDLKTFQTQWWKYNDENKHEK
jgi:hypothetical protein